LSNRDILVRILENRSSILVYIQIVWSRENGNHRREITFRGLAVYRIARILGFMSSNDGKQVISVKEFAHSIVSDPPPVSCVGLQVRLF
jgi:hypothetical protein